MPTSMPMCSVPLVFIAVDYRCMGLSSLLASWASGWYLVSLYFIHYLGLIVCGMYHV